MKPSPIVFAALAALVGAGAGAGLRVAGLGAKRATADNAVGAAAEKSVLQTADQTVAAAKPQKEAGSSGGNPDQEKKKAKKKPQDKHGDKTGDSVYFKFSRQFVAPIVSSGEPKAMMILDVMIELSPEADDAIYADEPKLRDAVLKALLAQSANGELPDMLSDPELLESTRRAVLQNVREVIGEEARSVLLMDVGYQPF